MVGKTGRSEIICKKIADIWVKGLWSELWLWT